MILLSIFMIALSIGMWYVRKDALFVYKVKYGSASAKERACWDAIGLLSVKNLFVAIYVATIGVLIYTIVGLVYL